MARRIILNLAMSLDGFIADEAGGYDWIMGNGRQQLDTAERWRHEEFLATVDTVVMGRRCYDQQLHHEYRDKQVAVATSRPLPDSGNVRFVTGDICAYVRELQTQPGSDIYLFGGGILIKPFLEADMIDEYILGLIPVLLGDGIPLFLHGHAPIPLELTRYYLDNGVVILRYLPLGRRG